jgi:hypothetical protein
MPSSHPREENAQKHRNPKKLPSTLEKFFFALLLEAIHDSCPQSPDESQVVEAHVKVISYKRVKLLNIWTFM